MAVRASQVGLPGGIRIFTSVLQAVINVIDHKMSPQEAVEAPRMWTQGAEVQLERTFPSELCVPLCPLGPFGQSDRLSDVADRWL